MTVLLAAALPLGLLAAAWSAGFFWSWSFTVMLGLSAARPEAAVEAMRAVNANITGPSFAFVFFGPAVFAALAAALAFAAGWGAAASWALAEAVLYGAGVVGVTVAANLPLNAALAAAPLAPDTAAEVWRAFAGPWTAWNHLRTGAASLAFAALAAAGALAIRG
ncbi:hypothetical protein GCM10009416_18080 [Craurococcus roseus]|uniref:DUF1772 domain-containing protein n=1 Tax=Craurococcus roseus TaxID=77585 RepID=A0ABN1F2J6_9PROT